MNKRLDIEAIRQRAENATGGEWSYTILGGETRTSTVASFGKGLTAIGEINALADADFIAHAREDIPALLAEVERLRNGIATAIKETSCDDTWDYLNRVLDGKEPLNLSYRIGGDSE